MIIKIIFFLFAIFVLFKVALRFKERKINLKEFIFWIIFWLAVGLVVILPETTSFLANLVGVGRGSDLAIYLAILLLFYLVFRIFVRLDNLDYQLTKLIRREAIEEFKKKNKNGIF